MTKQQKTYILIAIVVFVWGVVGFQIFGYMNPESEEITDITYKKFTPQDRQQKESYEVSSHERDPFLDKYTAPKKKKTTTVRKKKTNIPFPPIQYNGIVKNGGSKSFIITINGTQNIMKIGDVISDIKLVSGTISNIKVRFQGEYKVIPK